MMVRIAYKVAYVQKHRDDINIYFSMVDLESESTINTSCLCLEQKRTIYIHFKPLLAKKLINHLFYCNNHYTEHLYCLKHLYSVFQVHRVLLHFAVVSITRAA